jgi:catechol 2,3-dioxygenase-like lactoylglutathione lyase family enzyme
VGVAFNHLGQCVTDLERSRRFYVDVLGFEPWREINPPDTPSNELLRLPPPLGLTACYLRRDGLVLELLHYAGEGARPDPTVQRANRDRVMNEPGLTHISVSVDDIPETCARIRQAGGDVLDDTDIGMGIFVRDPDGQLIELLPMAYRDSLDDTGG